MNIKLERIIPFTSDPNIFENLFNSAINDLILAVVKTIKNNPESCPIPHFYQEPDYLTGDLYLRVSLWDGNYEGTQYYG